MSQCLPLRMVREGRAHKNNKRHKQTRVLRTTTAIVLLFLFCYAAYILCFVFQISFIKLPAEPTLILAINRLFLFSPPSLPPSVEPPYTCSDNHSSVSRLHPPSLPSPPLHYSSRSLSLEYSSALQLPHVNPFNFLFFHLLHKTIT